MTNSVDSRETLVQEESYPVDRHCSNEEKNDISIKNPTIANSTAIPSIDALDNDEETFNTNMKTHHSLIDSRHTLNNIQSIDSSRKSRPGLPASNIEVKRVSLKKNVTQDGRHVVWKSASSIVDRVENINICGGEGGIESSQPILNKGENYEDNSGAESATKHTTILSNPTEDSTHPCYSSTTNSITLTTSFEKRRLSTNGLLRRSNLLVSKILAKSMIPRRKEQWLCSLREPENDERRMEMVFFERYLSEN
mmetsp:Transcript_23168/g.54779  ORF Transcript_23168/g.54779 Transcript_23168/m.54779 type:complete len:252 (-) Transcript_23168:100-855(-)